MFDVECNDVRMTIYGSFRHKFVGFILQSRAIGKMRFNPVAGPEQCFDKLS